MADVKVRAKRTRKAINDIGGGACERISDVEVVVLCSGEKVGVGEIRVGAATGEGTGYGAGYGGRGGEVIVDSGS